MGIQITPSILNADFAALGAEVRRIPSADPSQASAWDEASCTVTTDMSSGTEMRCACSTIIAPVAAAKVKGNTAVGNGL